MRGPRIHSGMRATLSRFSAVAMLAVASSAKAFLSVHDIEILPDLVSFAIEGTIAEDALLGPKGGNFVFVGEPGNSGWIEEVTFEARGFANNADGVRRLHPTNVSSHSLPGADMIQLLVENYQSIVVGDTLQAIVEVPGVYLPEQTDASQWIVSVGIPSGGSIGLYTESQVGAAVVDTVSVPEPSALTRFFLLGLLGYLWRCYGCDSVAVVSLPDTGSRGGP